MSSRTSGYSQQFSQFIRRRRAKLGLSLRQLEARTGIHNGRLWRWEQGDQVPDRPDRLAALARGLGVPVADLYAVAGIELPDLPSLPLYLRSKYGTDLPPEALADIAAYSDQVAQRYGVTLGPLDGEDEAAP